MLDALLSIPSINNYKISKNSSFIAYNWRNVHPNLDVFLVPSDGSTRPIALTETLEATFVVSFSLDSQTVIVGEDKGLFSYAIQLMDFGPPLTEF